MSDVILRRALSEEAGRLSEIALQAKRHWGYPEDWINLWRDDLTITPDFITANEVYVADDGDDILGFCAVTLHEGKAELEHMWVRPEHIGTGLGRKLFTHVMERATALKAHALEISADPNAAGFYERLGARQAVVNVVNRMSQQTELFGLLPLSTLHVLAIAEQIAAQRQNQH